MRFIGWAIALAAAALTPAAAQTPATTSTPATAAQPGATPPAGTAQNPTGPDAPTAAANPAQTPVPPNSLGVAAPAGFQHAAPQPGVGIPIRGGKGIQEQVTPIGREAAHFHNFWLMITITAISVFVLVLLLWVIIRYRRGAHPVPSRNSHNTTIEVLWTIVPVLILVAIAIPSIRLLRHQYSPPPVDLTVKVIGNQWYWSYEYPDHGVTFDSYMLKEQNDPTRQANQRPRTDADGPPLLATDERLVLPAGQVVKFIVTSNDVIHAFWVPAFWNKIDANPGQLNEIWAKVDRPGVYFGQCTELCGARHAYMPIAVEVVPPAQFAAWVASKGGKMPGAQPAAARPDSTAISPNSPSAVAPPPAAAPKATTGTPRNAAPAAPAPQNPNVANRSNQ